MAHMDNIHINNQSMLLNKMFLNPKENINNLIIKVEIIYHKDKIIINKINKTIINNNIKNRNYNPNLIMNILLIMKKS